MLALVLLLACESSFVLGLQELTIEDYIASRDPVAGAVYLAMLVVFAIMPALFGRNA